MKAILKIYSNKLNYDKDFPDKVKFKPSITEAIEEAKGKIRTVRNTEKFLGFKVFDKHEKLKYKLPSY